MAKRQDSGGLDNFNYVQALKQASERKRAAPRKKETAPLPVEEEKTTERLGEPPPPDKRGTVLPKSRARSSNAPADEGGARSPNAPAPTPTAEPAKRGARTPAAAPPPKTPPVIAGRAVLPTKRLVVCHQCGYSHTATGNQPVTYCPKCRAIFVTDDIEVDAPRAGNVFTIGDITINAGASFEDGAKIGGKVVKVGADVSNLASITATDSLVLLTGANLGGVKVENVGGHVLVPAGEKVEMNGGFVCAELEIAGELRADVRAENSAAIRENAVFSGAISTPRITIDDGATTYAEIRITPQE